MHTLEFVYSVCRMKNCRPMLTLILDRRVASVHLGETDQGLRGRSCLNSGTLNQSSLSTPPLCFSLLARPLHTVMEVRRGQKLRMDNQAAAVPTIITAAHISPPLCRLYTEQRYYPARSAFIVFISHLLYNTEQHGSAITFFVMSNVRDHI